MLDWIWQTADSESAVCTLLWLNAEVDVAVCVEWDRFSEAAAVYPYGDLTDHTALMQLADGAAAGNQYHTTDRLW